MKISIIGATGHAGSALVAELLKHHHQVLSIARSQHKLRDLQDNYPQLSILAKDALTLTKADLADSDVIIDSFATGPETAYQHIDLAAKLIALYRQTETPRLIFILGAGSLQTGVDSHLLVEDITKSPRAAEFIVIPKTQSQELNFLRNVKNVNWVGVSPSANFTPGPATDFKLGSDDLLTNSAGLSKVSTGTFAVAIRQEIEHPQFKQTRFTVVEK